MNIHYLQHVPFEGLGSIESWAHKNGHTLSVTRLFAGDQFPALDKFDMLIVMGGPMSIHDSFEYPWLKAERQFIEMVLNTAKPILGICLGAQMLASILGAEVVPGEHKEIGWFPIKRDPALGSHPLASVIPEKLEVFHWHGETFNIPDGATPIASSKVCANQGFTWGDNLIALQFHLETTPASAESLITFSGDELVEAPYIQDAEEMLSETERFTEINAVMVKVMDYLVARSE